MTIPAGALDFARKAVRERVESFMEAQITILRGGTGTLNETSGRVSGLTGAVTIYEGKARIHTVSGEGSVAVGEGQIDVRQTVVSIPWDATPIPRRDDVVLVNSDDQSDPDLKNRAMRVVEVSGGSLFGDARRLSCTLWNESRYWTGGRP